MILPPKVRIVEVGPRDGLQNEKTVLAPAARIALIEALADTGLTSIECGSFVSPRAVPQMEGTAEIMRALPRRAGVRYPVLVPNMQGLALAEAFGAKEIAIFASASESFSRKNINASIAKSLTRYAGVAQAALQSGMVVRGYVSCIATCPYEGPIASGQVAHVVDALCAMGCTEISLGDTTGAGTPGQIAAVLDHVLPTTPASRLALHCHDTYGQALANILIGLQRGITVLDAAVGGLGGCPYAPGASGNVATEDLVYMLHGMGVETGIDLPSLCAVGRSICQALGRETGSRVAKAIQN